MSQERPREIRPASFFKSWGLSRQIRTLTQAPEFTGSDFCRIAEATISLIGGESTGKTKQSNLAVDRESGLVYGVTRTTEEPWNFAWVEVYPAWYAADNASPRQVSSHRNWPAVSEAVTWGVATDIGCQSADGQVLPVVRFMFNPTALLRDSRDLAEYNRLLTNYPSVVLGRVVDLSNAGDGEREEPTAPARVQMIFTDVLRAIGDRHIQDQIPGRNYEELMRSVQRSLALSRAGCMDARLRRHSWSQCYGLRLSL